jgi:hypothetical protein
VEKGPLNSAGLALILHNEKKGENQRISGYFLGLVVFRPLTLFLSSVVRGTGEPTPVTLVGLGKIEPPHWLAAGAVIG